MAKSLNKTLAEMKPFTQDTTKPAAATRNRAQLARHMAKQRHSVPRGLIGVQNSYNVDGRTFELGNVGSTKTAGKLAECR